MEVLAVFLEVEVLLAFILVSYNQNFKTYIWLPLIVTIVISLILYLIKEINSRKLYYNIPNKVDDRNIYTYKFLWYKEEYADKLVNTSADDELLGELIIKIARISKLRTPIIFLFAVNIFCTIYKACIQDMQCIDTVACVSATFVYAGLRLWYTNKLEKYKVRYMQEAFKSMRKKSRDEIIDFCNAAGVNCYTRSNNDIVVDLGNTTLIIRKGGGNI